MSSKIQSTVIVIRAWNNPHVEKRVRAFLTMGAGKILVVVNSTQDKGSTKAYLGDLLKDSRVEVLDMFEGYTWSNALNRALSYIPAMNFRRRTEGKQQFRFVLNCSVEALFTKEHVERMLDAITDDADIGVVGTSFEGRMNGNPVQLGREYDHPRNTGMVIRLEAFQKVYTAFDPRCDQIGSMEDFDFMLRLVAFSEMKVLMLDLNVPLVVGANYHPSVKTEREQRAMDNIIAYWLDLCAADPATCERLNRTLNEMGSIA